MVSGASEHNSKTHASERPNLIYVVLDVDEPDQLGFFTELERKPDQELLLLVEDRPRLGPGEEQSFKNLTKGVMLNHNAKL